mmetsp:Transcript_32974/g.52848  ORF Transcript_32974/g.52848 Transcript_32974/m.52848 type:complete len:201 (+) Transcript_32974:1869-2471(+)
MPIQTNIQGRCRAEKFVKCLPAETEPVLGVVTLEHRLENGRTISETILSGAQPHTVGQRGPVLRMTSPYRGVSYHACTQRWRSRIKAGTRSLHLGYFCSDVEAAKAYNQVALQMRGGIAKINCGVEIIGDPESKQNFQTTLEASSFIPYATLEPFALSPEDDGMSTDDDMEWENTFASYWLESKVPHRDEPTRPLKKIRC